MAEANRRPWTIIASLIAIQFFIAGPIISTFTVFFSPLMKEFAWTHAQVSRTATSYQLVAGLSAPLVGWLLDRIKVQWLMTVGAVMVGAGFLLASETHSLNGIVAMYGLIGLGVSASTALPGLLVATNWFERRGTAIGVMLCGMSAGMVFAPMIVSHLILVHGWRMAMRAIALPILGITIPVMLLFIRTKPGFKRRPTAEEIAGVPGLEYTAAIRTSAFWCMMGIELFYGVTFGAVYFHIVPYLIHIGFGPQTAATIFGLQAALSGVGWVLNGMACDRFSAKYVLQVLLGLLATSVFGLLGAKFNIAFISLFLAFWAASAGATGPTLPLLVHQNLGMRRFGSIMGTLFLTRAIAGAIAPVLSGMLVDWTGGYALSFELAIACVAATAVCTGFIFPAKGHDQIPKMAVAQVAAS
jgi:MFS family permease